MEQDSWERTGGTGQVDRTGGTGQIGQGNRDRTTAGHSGYGIWDRTTETRQPGQVNLDRIAWTGEPGKNRKDKSGHDSKARTTASGERQVDKTAGAGELAQESWDAISRTGQLGQTSQRRQSGQYIQGRKQTTRQPEQDSKGRTRGKDNRCRSVSRGHLGQNHSESDSRDKLVWKGHPGRGSLDRTEMTGLPEHDSSIKRAADKVVGAEQLWNRTAGTGQHTVGIGQLV
jgi:hypothetical protein